MRASKRTWVLAGVAALLGVAVLWVQRPAAPGAARATRVAKIRNVSVAVPQTLEESMAALDAILPDDVVGAMRQVPEAEMLAYHDGLGRWIRNNWGLWSKGTLYQHLRARGLDNPDEMSAVILASFWRHLHSQALDVEGQVRLIRQRPQERARQ